MPGSRLERPAAQRPTRERAPQLQPRELLPTGASPRSALAAAPRQPVVVGVEAAGPAVALAPWALRAEAHPRPAREARRSHPSRLLRAAPPTGRRRVLAVEAAASQEVAQAARPRSAPQAAWVPEWALPTSARPAARKGPRRRALHPTRARAERRVRHRRRAAGEVAMPGRPRLPGRRPSPVQMRADPSWALLQAEPRPWERQGSGRARPQGAPRWLRYQRGATRSLNVVEQAGGRAARASRACGAGA